MAQIDEKLTGCGRVLQSIQLVMAGMEKNHYKNIFILAYFRYQNSYSRFNFHSSVIVQHN
jgi:hypothetical protein